MPRKTNGLKSEVMGAPRVTPQEIVQMHKLYAQLGNYAAVGKAMGRSGSTAAKHIKMQGVSANMRIAVEQALAK